MHELLVREREGERERVIAACTTLTPHTILLYRPLDLTNFSLVRMNASPLSDVGLHLEP